MKKIKSIIIGILAITSTLALYSCGNNSSSTPDNSLGEESIHPNISQSDSSSNERPNQDQNNSTDTENKDPILPNPPSINYTHYLKCIGVSVNLRNGPGNNNSILGQAHKNDIMPIISQTGNWYKTFYKNKHVYIHKNYTTIIKMEQSTNQIIENVIEEGYKLLGTPYVYGAIRLHDGYGNFLNGFDKNKYDCSSLVQYVFYKGGNKILQTTTRTQVKQGKYVAKKDLKRGDCMFFTNSSRQNKTGIERIGHVAIYLGDNYILHTASGYAKIEEISQQRHSYYIESRSFI